MIAVTGATGFLGQEIVRSALRRGLAPVRCLVRPGTTPARLRAAGLDSPGVEVVPCRLEDAARVASALAGVEIVYHAAAAKAGSPAALVASTVVASEALYRAAVEAQVGRLVLVSSFATIEVAPLRRGAMVDERAPLEPHPERRDAYAFAKHRQEVLAWRFSEERGLPLAVVRPGIVFGPGQEILGTRIGLRLFGLFLHLGGRNAVPLTWVENCADAVVLAGTAPGALGEAVHVVDDELPTSAELLRRHRREVAPLRVVPLPYPLLRTLSRLNAWYSARTDGHLPAVFTPYKVDSLWRAQRYSNARAKALLGWSPRVPMREALDRTFAALARGGSASPRPVPAPAHAGGAGAAARAEASA
ncbi:MAG TPA: NAD-dependent epimerase/dehydratase family protein [Anaeromyxobacter sp.]